MSLFPDVQNGKNFVGVGYKSNYYENLMLDDPKVGWLEIHAENYMIDGGPRMAMMRELSEKYPISCHGVGLSIGSESGINPEHLQRLKTLIAWLQPAQFSEHLAWSSHNAGFYNDLLPLPYTKNVLDRVCTHIDQVQDELGRKMLLENPSSYVQFSESDIPEVAFIKEIVNKTGCGLLLDVNNVYVSAINQDYDPYAYIDSFPIDAVGEIHLGGHDQDEDDDGNLLLIDSHNNPVIDPVWELYTHSLKKGGVKPTLIEWDNDLPEWKILERDALSAAQIIDKEIAEHAHVQAS